ncbi:MAG: hypothetical protein J5I62_00715 [Flavobacteriales bacterium]|nr:hypothetical protein [Flavobacteriales bacterium]MEB2342213.1 hypothetical protein [Flavobacteriia bacterium]
MRFPLHLLATAGVLLGVACGTASTGPSTDGTAPGEPARATLTDLSAHHLPLLLETPADAPAPDIVWKDEFGKLMVRAGDHFALEIFEAPSDLNRLKADLDRDLLRKNTIVEEAPDLLIYRSEFPDDSTLLSFHFNRSVTVGDRTFQIQDAQDDGMAFSLEEVRTMAVAVRPRPGA